MARRLSQIVKQSVADDPMITGVTADSRKVGPGVLFAALPGTKIDGASFIPAAIEAGADGVLLDEFSPAALAELVPRLRALAAARGSAVVLEASGVQPEQLAAYAATGIDLISTSAPVTRSSWLDLSMRFDP